MQGEDGGSNAGEAYVICGRSTATNAAPSGAVTLSGTVERGQTLSASNTLADGDGLGAVSYQWQSSADGSTWANIGGATGASYTLAYSDMSKQVRAVVRTQVVQAAQDGVLSEMLAREGQTIKKGDVLALLESTRARAAYEDSVNTVAALNAALARLRAEVYSTPISFGPELQGFSSFRANQERLFRASSLSDLSAHAALDFGRG